MCYFTYQDTIVYAAKSLIYIRDTFTSDPRLYIETEKYLQTTLFPIYSITKRDMCIMARVPFFPHSHYPRFTLPRCGSLLFY